MPAVGEREWSTDGVPAAQQTALWESMAAEAWVPVSIRRAGGGPLPSRVAASSLGAVEISRIATDPQHVSRTDAHVAAAGGAKFFLNLPLTAGSSARQAGREVALAPRDFTLLDSDRPFELRFGLALRQVTLVIPHEVLMPRLSRPTDALGVHVRGDLGVGAIASSALQAAARTGGTLDRRSARGVGQQLVELIALALGVARTPESFAGPELLAQAVIDEIDRSLTDPELTPALVAARVGISVRYLHRLVSDRGPSFARLLLARRLARAHAELTDASCSLPVTELALAHGFRDPSYFARAYKRQFGLTPTQARSRAAGPDALATP